MLNGSGGYIKINGGDIEIGTSGAASFKASMKELAGGGSASRSGLPMPIPSNLPDRFSTQLDAADLIAGIDWQDSLGYKALMPDGSTIRGKTDSHGITARFNSAASGTVKVLMGEGDWSVHLDADESINN